MAFYSFDSVVRALRGIVLRRRQIGGDPTQSFLVSFDVRYRLPEGELRREGEREGFCEKGSGVWLVFCTLVRVPVVTSNRDYLAMARTATIVGQGYVGLPLAQAAVKSGWKVWGLDTSHATVDALNSGRSHVDDLSDSEIEEMLASGYRATLDPACVEQSDVILICVPTPLGDAGAPDLTAVRAASKTVGKNLASGSLVVLESTTYPGTTDGVVLPILEAESGLEAGVDFDLAFSPERVDPGNAKYGIENTPKLVGGVATASTEKAVDFYSDFVDEVVPLSGAREAETAKLLENTFRHVNIALVNEMAKFCHELDIDIWEVIRGAATKPFGFMRFTPGPGVGGHCIPIDPNYRSYEVRRELGYPFRFVELAQEINNSMPDYVATRVAELLNEKRKSVNGAKILLLGVSYKRDIADTRETPATPIAERLFKRGADVRFHDPFVDTWCVAGRELKVQEDLGSALSEADVTVLLQPHSAYDIGRLEEESNVLFDTQGVAPTANRL